MLSAKSKKVVKRTTGKITLTLLKIFLIAFLPFWCLIRSSVYFFESLYLPVWIAIVAGILLTTLLLLLYTYVISKKLKYKQLLRTYRSLRIVVVSILCVLVLYCVYVLVYIPETQTKTASEHSEFSGLHPLLKLAVGTIVLFDSKVVVTDIARKPPNYEQMGLKKNSRSLHYVQNDGYIHAVDLRTQNRSFIRNTLTKWYFDLLGFYTLRHTGSADHLHIHLEVHGERVVR